MNSAVRTIKIDREISSGDFRSAMRHLAGGVSVITVGRAKDITGMTVTSVSSLSVEPPTLIVSINRESSSWPLLKRYAVVPAMQGPERRSRDGTQTSSIRLRARRQRADLMKHVAVWVFYGIGALALAYLALYAYAAFTGRDLQPGDPIHIFRKPDAPNYS